MTSVHLAWPLSLADSLLWIRVHKQQRGLLLQQTQGPRNMPPPTPLGQQQRPSAVCVGWGVAMGA